MRIMQHFNIKELEKLEVQFNELIQAKTDKFGATKSFQNRQDNRNGNFENNEIGALFYNKRITVR